MDEYSPTSLPRIAGVDVVVLDASAPVSSANDYIRAGAIRSIDLTGETAQLIASLWRQLPPDQQARCHIPPYGLRFYSDGGVILEASIYWQCNNIYGKIGGMDFSYQFDAKAPASKRLLEVLQRAAGDEEAV